MRWSTRDDRYGELRHQPPRPSLVRAHLLAGWCDSRHESLRGGSLSWPAGGGPFNFTLVPGSTTLIGPNGLFSGATFAVSGNGPGATVPVEVFVWNSAYGSTFTQAETTISLLGESSRFSVILGPDPSGSPGSLLGMSSITLHGNFVPEPGVVSLFLLGGAGMRRRATRGGA
jgi:hypothetical protein